MFVCTADSPGRRKVLDELLNFLPNVEEMLKKSCDTCLLQYALMTSGHLNAEAKHQAAKFKNRLFLDGRFVHLLESMFQLFHNMFSLFSATFSSDIAK